MITAKNIALHHSRNQSGTTNNSPSTSPSDRQFKEVKEEEEEEAVEKTKDSVVKRLKESVVEVDNSNNLKQIKKDSISLPLYEGDNLIGKSDECTVVLKHARGIMERHAVITLDLSNNDGKCFIEDLLSHTGTTLNKRTLKFGEEVELRAGDIIGVGQVYLRFDILHRLKPNNPTVSQQPHVDVASGAGVGFGLSFGIENGLGIGLASNDTDSDQTKTFQTTKKNNNNINSDITKVITRIVPQDWYGTSCPHKYKHLVSQQEFDQMNLLFRLHDNGSKGYLTKLELGKLLFYAMLENDSELVDKTFDEVDITRNGKLSFEELIEFIVKIKLDRERDDDLSKAITFTFLYTDTFFLKVLKLTSVVMIDLWLIAYAMKRVAMLLTFVGGKHTDIGPMMIHICMYVIVQYI